MRLQLSLIISSLLLVGCATNATVSPSQNLSLHTISPNTATNSEGGAMQRSLDKWLKEDWMPNSATPSSQASSLAPVEVSNGSGTTPNTIIVKDEEPFTLQKYVDKWKVYNENKAKMNEGKPKEASNFEMLQRMPLIGK